MRRALVGCGADEAGEQAGVVWYRLAAEAEALAGGGHVA